MENIINWRFGVVGNIVGEHTDSEGNVYYGTKTFTPGTKVYLDGKYWSEEWDTISVIGRNRFGRIVCDRVDVDIIENVRCQRIYKTFIPWKCIPSIFINRSNCNNQLYNYNRWFPS